MTIFQAIIIGVVEGLTEFLPVSSTGHIILTSTLLGVESTNFSTSFAIIIQLGAILAVLFLYFKKLFVGHRFMLLLATAFLPTMLIGLSVYPFIKQLLLEPILIAYSLIVGGVILLLFELWYEEKESDIKDVEQITFKQAFLLGLFQSLAMIPGVSRSGATIVGGMMMRLTRKAMVEFSFLLAVPTMLAASSYDLLKTGGEFTGGDWEILVVGFVVSFLVSILAIKAFLSFVQNYSFAIFGWYRIIVGFVALWFLW